MSSQDVSFSLSTFNLHIVIHQCSHEIVKCFVKDPWKEPEEEPENAEQAEEAEQAAEARLTSP